MDVVIQARYSSQRLPGKVLQKFEGKPLLAYLFERLRSVDSVGRIILATSSEVSDDPLARFVAEHSREYSLDLFRGPLENVLLRYKQTIQKYSLSSFVRISGDSPLLDPGLLKKMIELFHSSSKDMVTNVFPRSFPKGQSIEILNSQVFLDTFKEISGPQDQEHVTTFFYRHSSRFQILNYSQKKNENDIRLCVDTNQDAARLREIVSRMSRPHTNYSLADLIELYRDSDRGEKSDREEKSNGGEKYEAC